MAVGIQFYRAQECTGLNDSLGTQEFTIKMNDMFDAMNRKFPAEGIRKNSKDLEVLFVLHVCVVCMAEPDFKGLLG